MLNILKIINNKCITLVSQKTITYTINIFKYIIFLIVSNFKQILSNLNRTNNDYITLVA